MLVVEVLGCNEAVLEMKMSVVDGLKKNVSGSWISSAGDI